MRRTLEFRLDAAVIDRPGTVTAPRRGFSKRKRVALGAAGGFIVGLLLILWFVGVFGGNVRTVIPGTLYRSAQITGLNLDRVMGEYGIKTVINLRGGSSKDLWHRSEMAISEKYGARHFDIELSAVKMPPPGELQKFLRAVDTAPRPMLFHCRGGADRTGLASTLFLNIYQNVPLDIAQNQQLTWRYGHLKWFQAHAMDDFLNLYRETSNGLGMREWITQKYPALYEALPAYRKTTSAVTAKE